MFPRTAAPWRGQALRFLALYFPIAILHGLLLFFWTDVLALDYSHGFLITTFGSGCPELSGRQADCLLRPMKTRKFITGCAIFFFLAGLIYLGPHCVLSGRCRLLQRRFRWCPGRIGDGGLDLADAILFCVLYL